MLDLMVAAVVSLLVYLLVADILAPLAVLMMACRFQSTFGTTPEALEAGDAVARKLGEIISLIRANELDAEHVLRREMGDRSLLYPFEAVKRSLVLEYGRCQRLALLHGHQFPLSWWKLSELPVPVRAFRVPSLAEALLY